MTSAYDTVLDQDVMKADDHQKADDAEVPVHLWNSMFMKSWAADQKVQYSLALGWRGGLALFRQAHPPYGGYGV